MKSRYFKYVEIDKDVLIDFFNKHSELKKFINTDTPFYVRISKKPYAGLVHTIVGDNEDSASLSNKWEQLRKSVKKINSKKILNFPEMQLLQIIGIEKTKLIIQLTNDLCNKKWNLKDLSKKSEDTIVRMLQQYPNLSDNAINTFLIFGLFKQNVLCDTDPDFIKGLKYFLNKQNIDKQDIKNIKIKYEGQLTLFSLCMWRIRNERLNK